MQSGRAEVSADMAMVEGRRRRSLADGGRNGKGLANESAMDYVGENSNRLTAWLP